eukprot:894888-Amphidinium_carterae.1
MKCRQDEGDGCLGDLHPRVVRVLRAEQDSNGKCDDPHLFRGIFQMHKGPENMLYIALKRPFHSQICGQGIQSQQKTIGGDTHGQKTFTNSKFAKRS